MSVAYIFPGQGSQKKGMGAELFEKFSGLVKAADEILGYSIAELCLEDPREELVRRLLEYQQFKEVAGWLEDKREESRDVFYRGSAFDAESLLGETPDGYESLRPVGLYDLLSAFKLALDAAPKIDFHEVGREEASTEERSAYVLDVLSRRKQVSFFDLVTNVSRIVVVVTFAAILDLAKEGKAYIRQSDSDSGFWVYYKEPAKGPTEEASEKIEAAGEQIQ